MSFLYCFTWKASCLIDACCTWKLYFSQDGINGKSINRSCREKRSLSKGTLLYSEYVIVV